MSMSCDMHLVTPLLQGFEGARPLVLAGPCSAETPEQLFSTALELKARGITVFRAGLWKPRTKPGGFEGVGSEGLEWLCRVKNETGLRIATEVATARHVELCLQAGVDLLWIGARTTANPFAVQDLADALQGTDVPVLVKNPVNPDLELWIGALERLNNAGVCRLGAIHRGFGTYERTLYRNQPQWHIPIELRRRIPHLPLFCDPSHIGGRRDLVESLCQQAMDLNFDGLIIESHCNPDAAWSDAAQQVTPRALGEILQRLVIRSANEPTELLAELRRQIDACDEALIRELSKRMSIVREIGRYKREHGITILQTGRYSEILEKRGRQGAACGMDEDFVRFIFEAIHEESVRRQLEFINQKQ